MARSRRKTRRRRVVVTTALLALAAATAGGWWYFKGRWPVSVSPANASPMKQEATPLPTQQREEASLVVDLPAEPFTWPSQSDTLPKGAPTAAEEVLRPVGSASQPALSEVPRRESAGPAESAGGSNPPTDQHSDNAAIEAARRQYAEGKLIDARHTLNALLQQKLSRPDQAEVRKLLSQIADETVFATRRLPDDPLAEMYTVQPGEALVHIGRQFKLPPEILMKINGIKDATKLRAEQKIKALKGPFHAKIYKSDFRLDVYLQDLYVRSFRVALGADQGTPEGVWRVKERLENPTYYPSPSAEEKRIIAADDPKNPLGERWIGLEGIEGDAQGRYGYGIHGTIEPDSIGKAVSLGCVRMYNEDVEFLYGLLLPGQSTVTVLP